MTTTLVALVTVLLVVSASATTPSTTKAPNSADENTTEIVQAINELFAKDDFSDVKTIEIKVKTPEEPTKEPETKKDERKRRSIFDNRCGPIPAQRTTFVRCFAPSGVTVQRQSIVRNYYRRGDYGQCINYFRSLPLVNVIPAQTGYTGQLRTTSGRVYSVSTCQRCYRGNPGISVRCVSNPANKLVRNFIFSPQINNYNYNTYLPASVGFVSGGSYDTGRSGGSSYGSSGASYGSSGASYGSSGASYGSSGASYGSSGASYGSSGSSGYGSGRAGFSGNVAYGGNVGYVVPVAGYVDPGFIDGGSPGNGIGYASGNSFSDGGFGISGDFGTGGGHAVQQGSSQTGTGCVETIGC